MEKEGEHDIASEWAKLTDGSGRVRNQFQSTVRAINNDPKAGERGWNDKPS